MLALVQTPRLIAKCHKSWNRPSSTTKEESAATCWKRAVRKVLSPSWSDPSVMFLLPQPSQCPEPRGAVQVPCPQEVFPKEERGLQHPHPLPTGARWSLTPQPANSLMTYPQSWQGSQSAPDPQSWPHSCVTDIKQLNFHHFTGNVSITLSQGCGMEAHFKVARIQDMLSSILKTKR